VEFNPKLGQVGFVNSTYAIGALIDWQVGPSELPAVIVKVNNRFKLLS
jgi:hypothetical protein